MIPEINYLAVVLAALSTMVVGSIWYTPKVFGSIWMRLAKVDPEKPSSTPLWLLMSTTLLISFVSAWVLAGAAALSFHFYGGSFLMNALVTAIILWAGFTAGRIITHDSFEGRPKGLTLLSISNEFVTFVVMALVIGAFGI